jgi:predicted Zn-ribbon and HTH transcriptional regulator
MKVDIYDLEENHINTIENAKSIIGCRDGRHLVTYPKKCETCGNIEDYTWQVPQGYRIEIKN